MRFFLFTLIIFLFGFPVRALSQCLAEFRVLHYTETTGYDHNTRSVSEDMLEDLGLGHGFSVTSDDTGMMFSSPDSLAEFAVVVFSNTSGEQGLDSSQRAHFEAYMNAGGGFVGIHAAGDTYRHSSANGNNTGSWDWYAEHLTGASVQVGPSHTHWSHVDTLIPLSVAHPALDSIPNPWVKQEEYYYWENGYLDTAFIPLLNVKVTGNDSYDSTRMMAQYKELPGGGRAFYTALGHAQSNYTSDTIFRQLILDALLWAAEPSLPVPPEVMVTATASCAALGSVTVAPLDSSNTYAYLWSTGDTTETVTGLSSGTYFVMVTGPGGCTTQDSVTLQSNPTLVPQLIVLDSIDCFGGSNGSILVSATGGTPPYQFAWASGDTNTVRSGLPAGTYFGTITDANGCVAGDSSILSAPTPLSVQVSLDNSISCFGGSDGAISVQASGGTPGYTYAWGNGDTTSSRAALPAGSYVAIITDANGCTESDSLTLTTPPELQTGLQQDNPVSCFGGSDGAISVMPFGGVAPYEVVWANGDTSMVRQQLPSGAYFAVVTDSLDCTVNDSLVLTEPDSLFLNVVIVDTLRCFGDTDGILKALAFGGQPPYRYTWIDGLNSDLRVNVGAGSHTAIVTDNQGCKDSLTVTLTSPGELLATLIATPDSSCLGQPANGSLTADASGGTPPYEARLDGNLLPGPGPWNVEDLAPGLYAIEVTDVNDCVKTVEQTIENICSTDDLESRVFARPWGWQYVPGQQRLVISGELLQPTILDISLLDIRGRQVAAVRTLASSVFHEEIFVTGLASGLYLVRIHTSKGEFVQKLLIP